MSPGKRVLLGLVATIVLAVAGPSAGSGPPASPDDPAVPPELGRHGGPILIGPPTLPEPPEDPPTIDLFEPEAIQLVGFTASRFTGDRGVLGFARACQVEFPGSRMCTTDEIRFTLLVPEPPAGGFAWVQALATDDVPAPADGAIPISRDPPLPHPESCRQWRSNSARDFATAVELGPCYGAFVTVPCDRSLAIACCAPVRMDRN